MTFKPTTFSFSDLRVPESGVVVILAEEGGALTPAGKTLDKASGGVIARAAKINGFNGQSKSSMDLVAPSGLKLDRLIVVGTGKLSGYSANDWMNLGGMIRGKLAGANASEATVVVEAASGRTRLDPEFPAHLAAGALLRGYKFEKYKTRGNDNDGGDEGEANGPTDKNGLTKVVVQCAEPSAARTAFNGLKAICEGVAFARDLVNEPANILGPVEFAKQLEGLSKLGVKVTVLDEKELKKLKAGAILAVGQGSARPTLMVVMEWNGGAKSDAPAAIVGKGVCFDTGGISIKPAAGMEDMKGDMAGAACVGGLMQALAARKAKANVVGVVGLTENMPSGTATRPGDIVTSMSGQTIEVLNTDAEGRLVLADCLWYVQEKYKPKWVVNLATLTGAILIALGKEHAGLFSNDDALSAKLTKAGEATEEKLWRLPLGPKYDELLKSKTADMKNIGGRLGGSITAAQFLQRFIRKGTPWAHLDIAGTGMAAPQTDINQSWGSGFGVRLLDRVIADSEEKK